MNDVVAIESEPQETEQLKKAIEDIFHEMEQSDQRIRLSQKEIDRLKFETQALLKELKAAI